METILQQCQVDGAAIKQTNSDPCSKPGWDTKKQGLNKVWGNSIDRESKRPWKLKICLIWGTGRAGWGWTSVSEMEQVWRWAQASQYLGSRKSHSLRWQSTRARRYKSILWAMGAQQVFKAFPGNYQDGDLMYLPTTFCFLSEQKVKQDLSI